ncbi:hypothetical protein ACGFMM_27540 [Streptomyces sp. NPDC048604]|uniref:hypothetical protein n=1 Tax=Streptomyces sp. NPDC048604 TaxID=3365578 RepID=UPI00372262FD
MSETPMNPQQPPVPTGPTQPLPPAAPAAPGWGAPGPAAGQPPYGQPPMPDRPAGPPPAGAPAPTSAWTQPLPPFQGQNGATGTGRPGGVPTPWLIGGAAAFVAAVVIAVVVATSGGGGTNAAPGGPAGVPGAPGAEQPEPGGKAFTKVPEGCDLIKPATVAGLVPGAECKPSQFDNATLASMITKMPEWDTPMGSGGPMLTVRVSLVVSPAAKGQYDMKKTTALTGAKTMRTSTGRALSGLGEEAMVVHHVGKAPFDGAESEVVVREGNAAFTVQYNYNPEDSGRTQAQAEQGAIAAARDVLGSLS